MNLFVFGQTFNLAEHNDRKPAENLQKFKLFIITEILLVVKYARVKTTVKSDENMFSVEINKIQGRECFKTHVYYIVYIPYIHV